MARVTQLGTDFSLRSGLTGALVSGTELLVESLSRRLRTRRGALFYDPDYGSYFPDALGDSFTDGGAALAALAEVDLEGDPRVAEARVTVLSHDLRRVELQARLTTVDGPVALVIEAMDAHLLVRNVEEVLPYGVG